MKPTFELVVGNIGSFDVTGKAWEEFNEYKALSKANYGRVAGESVTLFRDGEVVGEYIGTLQANSE